MINPTKIIEAIVLFLQSSPEVLRQVNNKPESIFQYRDSPPTSSVLTRAIFQMPTPSILIAYMGSTVGSEGRIGHSFSIYLRARDTIDPKVPSYATLCTTIINARGIDSDLTFLNTEFIEGTYAIDTWNISRVHDEDGRIDLFEIPITIQEKWENIGYPEN